MITREALNSIGNYSGYWYNEHHMFTYHGTWKEFWGNRHQYINRALYFFILYRRFEQS